MSSESVENVCESVENVCESIESDSLMIDNLFEDVFSGKPVSKSKFFGGSFSVVGSSGNLLREKKGAEIERFDKVIRMNNAPAGGKFVFNVGTRTDIRVIAHNAFKKNETLRVLKGTKVMIFWGTRDHLARSMTNLKRIRIYCPKLVMLKLSDEAMRVCDEEFARWTGVGRLASGAWLSTGWFSIFTALNLVGKDDKVKLYGFGANKKSDGLYHYWENPRIKEKVYLMSQQRARKGHRFITEMKIFALWAQKYNLEFN